MITNVIYKYGSEKIQIDVFFSIVPSGDLTLYEVSNNLAVYTGDKQADSKVSFFVEVINDNNAFYIKDEARDIKVCSIKLNNQISTQLVTTPIATNGVDISQKSYEVNQQKPVADVMPPPKKITTVANADIQKDFIRETHYDRGFNDGFLIGKSL